MPGSRKHLLSDQHGARLKLARAVGPAWKRRIGSPLKPVKRADWRGWGCSYEELARAVLGKAGSKAVNVCIVSLNITCMVAYISILADVLSSVAGSVIPPGAEPSRNVLMTGALPFPHPSAPAVPVPALRAQRLLTLCSPSAVATLSPSDPAGPSTSFGHPRAALMLLMPSSFLAHLFCQFAPFLCLYFMLPAMAP